MEELEHARQRSKLYQMPSGDDGELLRLMAWNARNRELGHTPYQEFRNVQEFFIGEEDDPEKAVEHFDLCPTIFAIPLMRGVADVHAPEMVPRIDGPGVVVSLFRCVFSKALLMVQVHLSAEVKLPPEDRDSFMVLWKEVSQLPKSKIPVFVRAVWPDNSKMCGGGIVPRFNEIFGTEFAHDTPVDVVLSLYYVASWRGKVGDFLGVRGMRQRLAQLEVRMSTPQKPLLYPGTREISSPEYTADERVGMHVQYLAKLNDPQAAAKIHGLLTEGSAAVRMGCAKASLELGDRELFRRIVSREPEGRMQTYMTKMVRKRKARDLTDAIPRMLEEQYEFAAPLWTKRNTRIDVNTVEGSIDAARLSASPSGR
jgi:hypothetical protein